MSLLKGCYVAYNLSDCVAGKRAHASAAANEGADVGGFVDLVSILEHTATQLVRAKVHKSQSLRLSLRTRVEKPVSSRLSF